MSTLSVDTIQGQTTAANVKMPAGHIIQVQSAAIGANGQYSNSTTSFTDIVSVTITPKYASSKILFQMAGDAGQSGDNTALRIRLVRSIGGGSFSEIGGIGVCYEENMYESCAMSVMDSPNTTSACIYKLQGSLQGSNGTAYFPTNWGGFTSDANEKNTLTVMEISQ